MLKEYQGALNDSVWPGGITLHQKANFNTTPFISPLKLIYLLAKLQPFQFRWAWNRAACVEAAREQRQIRGGRTCVQKRRLQDNLRGKLTDGRRKRQDQTWFIFFCPNNCRLEIESSNSATSEAEGDETETQQKLIRQTRGINRALVSPAISQQSSDETGLSDSWDG